MTRLLASLRSRVFVGSVALAVLPILGALHVVSRAVFGEIPAVRATLLAARDILSPGLLMSLTLHRLNLARSLGTTASASRRICSW